MKKTLTILGCVVIFAGFVGASDSGCESIEESEKSSSQVTAAKIKKVELGDTKREVRKILGKPQDTQTMEVEGLKSECWYYGVLAENSWQFCFDDGKLSSKNRY